MQLKVKRCAGWDGKEHDAFIYKNIDGKKYCKACTMRLQPPKSINKMSEKQEFKMTLKKKLLAEDKIFYTNLWIKKFFVEDELGYYNVVKKPVCEVCGDSLGTEPNMMFFHHILEKRNYPALRHKEENIAICCVECHNMYETFPDSVPYLVQKRDNLLNQNSNNEERKHEESVGKPS